MVKYLLALTIAASLSAQTVVSTYTVGASPTIHVASYGAVCDGSTDDTTAIQSAITAAQPGTTIWIPAAKTCNFTVLDFSNKSAITVASGGAAFRDSTPVVSAGTLKATGTGGGSCGQASNGAIRLFGGTGNNTLGLTFQNVNFSYSNASLDCLFNISATGLPTPSTVTFRNATFNGHTTGSATKAVYFNNAQWIIFDACEFDSHYKNHIVSKGSTSIFNVVRIINSGFGNIAAGQYHIDLESGESVLIQGNNFRVSGAGIRTTNGTGSPANSFRGINITNNYFADTDVSTSSTYWIDTYGVGVSIWNNTLFMTAASTAQSGIRVRGSNYSIKTNSLFNCTGTCISDEGNNGETGPNYVEGSSATRLMYIDGQGKVIKSNELQGTYTNDCIVTGSASGEFQGFGCSQITLNPGRWIQSQLISGAKVRPQYNTFSNWSRYSVAKASGSWTVNGANSQAAAGALTQDITLFTLPANGYVDEMRWKTTTACSGAATIQLTDAGLTGTAGYYVTGATYDLTAAVSNTNILNTTMAAKGSNTAAATDITSRVTTTVSNVSAIADGCAFDVWVRWGVLAP